VRVDRFHSEYIQGRVRPLLRDAFTLAPPRSSPANVRGLLARFALRTRREEVLWAAAVLALLLLRLGAAPLFDVDEGAFAEATREMLASGDYGFTTLDGAPRFDKPILVYWLQAASVGLLGLSEGALRLPSALCTFGWAVAVAAFAARRWGRPTALLAGSVLVTSAGPLVVGRASTADALLNLLLALALFDAWRWIERPRPGPLRRAYLWVALGLLAKGPVAILIPAAVTLLFLWSAGEPRRWLRLALDAPGWAILLAVAAPWYVYALHRHGMAFVEGFLLRHNVARFTGTLEGHGGSLFYYALMLPVLLLPWAALLPSVLRAVPRLWRGDRLDRFLLLWSGFVLAFFSLGGTKLPHYALYGATPAFLLLARAAGWASPAARRATAATIGVLLLVLAIAPGLVPRLAPLAGDPLYVALLGGATRGAAVVQLGAALALAAWLAALARFRASPGALAGGAAALAVVIVALGVPWLAGALQGPVRDAALVARARREPVVQYRVRIPSFSVYRGAPTPRARPAPGQLAITTERGLASIGDVREVLFRENGYVLVRAGGPAPGGAGGRGAGP
jgi:4-amino-4-deoxy-L-arabinose transferase-like glycosyltransferase